MKKYYVDKEYSLEAVPQDKRKSFLPMLVVMLGFSFFSVSMLAGGSLRGNLTIKNFLDAVFYGNLLLCIYTGLLAYMAGDTGLSTHLLAKYSFGKKGSQLVSFLISITQIGWFGMGIALFSIPASYFIGIDTWILVLISGVLITITAYFGMKLLIILSVIAVPTIGILGGFSTVKAIEDIGGLINLLYIKPSGIITISTALSIVIGSFISAGIFTPDFARFAKNKKVAVRSTVTAFFIGNSIMFLFGALGVMTVGSADISVVMFAQGLIIPGIIVLALNIWTTNGNALYGISLGFTNITKAPKRKMVIVNGLIGTFISIFVYRNLVNWLNLLSTLIPPIGAVMLADYFIINKRKYVDFKDAKFEYINVNAILAWLAGTIGAYIIPGIIHLNSVGVAVITYVILTKLNKNKDIESVEMAKKIAA